jgi:hypothetical protein
MTDLIPFPAPTTAPSLSSFRASATIDKTLQELGPIQELSGRWQGEGLSLISRPDFHDQKPFFLQVNSTEETLTFTRIGAPIPNRGSLQDDIVFLGVHYLQEISDKITHGALHLEPGIWLNVPATTVPTLGPTVVRLATIPHGDSLVAQGRGFTVQGGPKIDPADSTPLVQGTTTPIAGEKYLAQFNSTPLPPGVPKGSIANPNLVLTEAIKDQDILETVVLIVQAGYAVAAPDAVGGIENIPFVVSNANAVSMSAIFWIEKVRVPDRYGHRHQNGHGNGNGHGGNGGDPVDYFLQLQYTQTVMLRFDDIDWPHISVATLVKH